MVKTQKKVEQESGKKDKGKRMEEIIIDDQSEDEVLVIEKPPKVVPDSQSQVAAPAVASSHVKVVDSDDDDAGGDAEVSTRLIVPSDPASQPASDDDDVGILEPSAPASSDERDNSQYIAPLRSVGGISRSLPVHRPFGISHLAPPSPAAPPVPAALPASRLPQRAPAPAPKPLSYPASFLDPVPRSSQSEDPIVDSSPARPSPPSPNPYRPIFVRADAPRLKRPAQLALVSAAPPRVTHVPGASHAHSRTAFEIVRPGARRALAPLLKPVRSMLPSPPLDGEDEGGVRARVQPRRREVDIPGPILGAEGFGEELGSPFRSLGEALGRMGGEEPDLGGDDFSAMIDFDGGESRGEMRDADAGGGAEQGGERAQAPTQQQNSGNVPPVVVVPSSFPAPSFASSSAGGFSNGGQAPGGGGGGGGGGLSDLLNPSHAYALPTTSKRVLDPTSTMVDDDPATKKARTSQPLENRSFDPPAPNATFSPTLARVLNADVSPSPVRQRSLSPGAATKSPSVRAVSVAASNSSRNASPAPAMPRLAVLLELIRATRFIDEADGTKAEVSRFVTDPQAYLGE